MEKVDYSKVCKVCKVFWLLIFDFMDFRLYRLIVPDDKIYCFLVDWSGDDYDHHVAV